MKLDLKERSENYYILLLLFSGIIIYFPSLFISFFGDEPAFILRNTVHSFSEWLGLLDKKDYDGAYYRPVGNLISGTLSLLFGSNEWLYRLFNLIIHSLNGVMVFKFSSHVITSDTNKYIVPFGAGLLFIVFPLHDLAVIWHTDLFDRLLLLFYLSSVIHYLKNKIHASLVFALIAFLTKEMSFSLPIIIALSAYFCAEKKPKVILMETALYFGLLAAVILFRYIVFDNYLFQSDLTHPDAGLFGIAKNMLFFGGLLLLPFDSYNIKEHFLNNPLIFSMVGVFLVILILFLLYRDRTKLRIYVFPIIFIILTLAPASRLLMKWYLYLPSVGFVIFIAMLLGNLKSNRVRFLGFSVLIVFYSFSLVQTQLNWIEYTSNNDAIIAKFGSSKRTFNELETLYFLTIPAKISGYPVNHLNPAELLRYKLKITNPIEILSRSAITNWYDKIDCFDIKNGIRLEHKFPNYFVLYGYENLLRHSRDDFTDGKLTRIRLTNLPDGVPVFSYSENKYFRIQ
ncbi:MAG: hypothetical protein SCALA702_37360 [Melioribacteraceae bacterium]|nr:MAG: hypothetical protein SCALA702_37360 [Melioribacteraceae bacterium]